MTQFMWCFCESSYTSHLLHCGFPEFAGCMRVLSGQRKQNTLHALPSLRGVRDRKAGQDRNFNAWESVWEMHWMNWNRMVRNGLQQWVYFTESCYITFSIEPDLDRARSSLMCLCGFIISNASNKSTYCSVLISISTVFMWLISNTLREITHYLVFIINKFCLCGYMSNETAYNLWLIVSSLFMWHYYLK